MRQIFHYGGRFKYYPALYSGFAAVGNPAERGDGGGNSAGEVASEIKLFIFKKK
jgi:hypothetical protein